MGRALSDVYERSGIDWEVPASDSGYSGVVGPDSDQRPVLSIVLPTRNEAEGITVCIRRIKRALEAMNLSAEILVSDSSSDRTPEIAREMGAIVIEPPETGYGNAYKCAFEHARGQFIVIGDADTTYDFEELPKLLEPIVSDRADLVLGSRFAGEIRPGAMPPLHKHVGNPLLTAFLNRFYGAGVTDAHSGFRAIRSDALERLELESSGMEFASEMIMDAAEKELRIAEVPITYHERVGEATLDSFEDGWRHVKFMLSNAPTYLFTIPGLLFGLVGVGVVLASVFSVSVGGFSFGASTVAVGSLLLLLGYQTGVLWVFSAVGSEPIKRPSGSLIEWFRRDFRLAHGAAVGAGLLVLGGVPIGYLAVEWLTGATTATFAGLGVLAFSSVAFGVLMIFNSFFLEILRDDRRRGRERSRVEGI